MGQFTEFVALGSVCEDQFKISQPRFKEYFLSSSWDLFDKRNTWFVDKYDDIYYGVETDGELKDCFGITILERGVNIGYHDQDGNGCSGPFVCCNADDTE